MPLPTKHFLLLLYVYLYTIASAKGFFSNSTEAQHFDLSSLPCCNVWDLAVRSLAV